MMMATFVPILLILMLTKLNSVELKGQDHRIGVSKSVSLTEVAALVS